MVKDYIHIGDKTYQSSDVVMLPTDKASRIGLHSSKQLFYSNYHYRNSTNFSNQHIYFLSEEKIVEGDWFVTDGNTLHQCNKILMGLLYSEGDYGKNSNGCKKVIAITDPTLKGGTDIKVKCPDCDAIGYNPFPSSCIICNGTGVVLKSLPRPSNSFIEAYVREWNKDSKIEKVLVEMQKYVLPSTDNSVYYKPKVTPDNTIIITLFRGILKMVKVEADDETLNPNVEHLNWIYNRMIQIHNENPSYDYMIKFRSIIDKLK